MKISTFIPPVPLSPEGSLAGVSMKRMISVKPSSDTEPDWCELASERRWEAAIITRLRQQPGEALPLWRVIGEIAAESRPPTQRVAWESRREILRVVTDLIQAGRVIRRERCKLLIMD